MTTTKTETADIVEQLRKSANTIYSQDGYTFRLGLHNEAADEIERLRRDLEEANARAYVMAQEVTLWQSRAALKDGE
jgi:hypothetical protein